MLRKFASLSPLRRRLLVQATARVAVIRLGLSVTPLSSVLSRVGRQADRPLRRQRASVPDLVWAVQVASRRLLRTNPCLTEALALWGLLRHHGYETELRIGVARDQSAGFQAHAWVERNGEVLIGGERSPDTYVPLPAFDIS